MSDTAAQRRRRAQFHLHPGPTHSLTQTATVPDPEARGRSSLAIEGDMPSTLNPPSGCRFHTRCPIAADICSRIEPTLVDHGGGRRAACHFAQVEGQTPRTEKPGHQPQ